MKKVFIAVTLTLLLFANLSYAQWCQQPDPGFCPGNRFNNGDFESVTGNPDLATHQDINLATGWGSIFTNGAGQSNADLACSGTSLCGGIPLPNNGGINSGMWIHNASVASNADFREQMYNRLVQPIAANTGFYSFTCKLASPTANSCQANTANTIDIAVYGVLNPTNTLANNPFTSLYTPSDLNLWNGIPGVQVVLLGTITTPVGLNANWQIVNFTFDSNILPAGGITHIMITRSPTPSAIFRKKFILFDEFCMQPTTTPEEPARGCCDEIEEPNLINNGNFGDGNSGFTSTYTYQGSIGANSVSEGMYSVLTGAEAANISNCWDIVDHTTCTNDEGKFMVINGKTHNPQSSIIYHQTGIPVEEGEEYIFCMYYQHLPQCAFDIFSPNNITLDFLDADFSIGGCETEIDDCGWTKISYTLIPDNNTLDIVIFLNQAGIGDGNDIAIDDISLRKKADVPDNICGFDVSSSTTGSNIVFTANSFTPIPAGFDVTWTVMEIDYTTRNPIPGTTLTYTWPPNSTNFPGYCCTPGGATPGAFTTGKSYRIIRNVTNCCYKDCNWVWEWLSTPMSMIEGAAKQPGDEPEKPFNGYYHYKSVNGQDFTPVNLTVANDNGINIFPNPGDGVVTIKSEHVLENTTLTIYGTDSKVVLKKDINGTKASIDIHALPNGVYTFEITEANGKVTHKKYVKQE
ncbi:MAG: T9SS type A sorting domain-containing protein [Flavipsychrobacter sp.]